MSNVKEALSTWDAADELLAEKVDTMTPVVDTIHNNYMLRKITNKEVTIELPAHRTFLMSVQSGSDGELYMIYTTDKTCICKVASNIATSGVTTLGTVSATGFTLTFQPNAWLCCTLISLNLPSTN